MYEKQEARKLFSELRKGLKSAEKDEKIARFALEEFQNYESFFVYLSFRTEVGTEQIVKTLLEQNKKVCVPRVVGDQMRSVRLHDTDKLRKGAFGISEPEGEEEETCQVAFTPLLAVDQAGIRLGYGGGFYDRYFKAHPKILRVGLAYEGQRTDELLREETDVPLNALVTENGVVYFDLNAQGAAGDK